MNVREFGVLRGEGVPDLGFVFERRSTLMNVVDELRPPSEHDSKRKPTIEDAEHLDEPGPLTTGQFKTQDPDKHLHEMGVETITNNQGLLAFVRRELMKLRTQINQLKDRQDSHKVESVQKTELAAEMSNMRDLFTAMDNSKAQRITDLTKVVDKKADMLEVKKLIPRLDEFDKRILDVEGAKMMLDMTMTQVTDKFNNLNTKQDWADKKVTLLMQKLSEGGGMQLDAQMLQDLEMLRVS